jgi:AraC-like DNA-binding protein
MHRHAELEFNLVMRGAGRYLLSNRTYSIRRGDLVWLFPAQEHVLMEQTLDFTMWIAVLKPAALKRIAHETTTRTLLQADPAGEFCRHLDRESLERLAAVLAEVAEQQGQPIHYNTGLAFAFLSAWRRFERAGSIPVTDVHPAVERVALLMRGHGKDLNLQALSRQAGLSASRLSRLFKQQIGVSLARYRNRQRTEAFLELYGTGQRMKMTDAAFQAGFGSYAQFYRVFKRFMGCSPRSYREGACGGPDSFPLVATR